MNSSRPVLSLEELEVFDPHAPTGVRRRFCCPLCGTEKPRDAAHRCLSVEVANGLWKCFRCDASGQLRDRWSQKPGLRSVRAQRATRKAFSLEEAGQGRAAALSGPTVPAGPAVPEPPETGTASEALRRALRGVRPLPETAGEAYLRGRGVSVEVCLAAKVKFAPSWLGRPAVVFPVFGEQGQLLAAQGRYIDGWDDPKTRTLGPKKEGVFCTGNFWEQVKRGAPVVLTEAPIDALSLAACGFPALALCGKSGWPWWLPIKCAFKEVAVAFDADGAGEKGANTLLPVLESLGARVRRLMPDGEGVKDWNEMLLHLGKDKMGDWLCLHLL